MGVMIQKLKSKVYSFFLYFNNPEIKRIKKEGLSYLTDRALLEIKKAVNEIEARKVPGILIETGCALGGSAILIALTKNKSLPFYVYDVFDIIPPPSGKDGEDVINRYETIISGNSKGINNDKYYGYEDNLKSKVLATFQRFGVDPSINNVHLVEGLYQDTLKINQPVAFAHIDCDWYESVMTCLVQIVPNLSLGGKLIIDDYYDWSGCQIATDEYFANKEKEFKIFPKAKKLHIERIV